MNLVGLAELWNSTDLPEFRLDDDEDPDDPETSAWVDYPESTAAVDFLTLVRSDGDRFLLAFDVYEWGWVVPQDVDAAFAEYMPPGVTIKHRMTPSGDKHITVTAPIPHQSTANDLESLWGPALRAALVVWAGTRPWTGFNGSEFDEVEPTPDRLSDEEPPLPAMVFVQACDRLSRAAQSRDPAGGQIQWPLNGDWPIPRLFLLICAASGYGTEELTEWFACWLRHQLDPASQFFYQLSGLPLFIESSSFDGQAAYLLNPRDEWGEHNWEFDPGEVDHTQRDQLVRIGWNPPENEWQSYWVPMSTPLIQVGRMVARAAVEVVGANLRDFIFELLYEHYLDPDVLTEYIAHGTINGRSDAKIFALRPF